MLQASCLVLLNENELHRYFWKQAFLSILSYLIAFGLKRDSITAQSPPCPMFKKHWKSWKPQYDHHGICWWNLTFLRDLLVILGFPGGASSKEPAGQCRRQTGSIPGWRRFPGGGHGNPLQDPCLENSMDRGASWATVHKTRLKWLSTYVLVILG